MHELILDHVVCMAYQAFIIWLDMNVAFWGYLPACGAFGICDENVLGRGNAAEILEPRNRFCFGFAV